MKQLQEENSRLKQLVADLSLDKTMLQDVLRKSSESLGARPMVDHLREEYGASERHGLPVLLMVRGTYRYQGRRYKAGRRYGFVRSFDLGPEHVYLLITVRAGPTILSRGWLHGHAVGRQFT